MTTIHKTYNPKNSSVTDVYHVDDDGHDRWFIPMLAPDAPMDEQLAQCKKLSPHGEGKDEIPDLPLATVNNGTITGSLLLGQSVVGNAATFKDGAKPYTITAQFFQATTADGTYSAVGSATAPNGDGQIIRTNATSNSGKYYKLKTIVTDAEDATLTVWNDTPFGAITSPDAAFIDTPPTPADQSVGSRETYVWLGQGNYNVTMQAAYMNAAGAWVEMNDKEEYAGTLNTEFPNLGLSSLIANMNGSNLSIVVASAGAGISVGESLQLKGQCTDTYSSLDDTVNQGMVINFSGTGAVTVDGSITGNKHIDKVLTGTVTAWDNVASALAKWMTSDTENGTYTDRSEYEAPSDGTIEITQLTTDAGKWWKLRTAQGEASQYDDSPAYGPTVAANANITEYSVSPIDVPVGQTTSKEFPGTYNYTGTWSMTYTDDSGWQTAPWMANTNIATDYNAMFGTSFTQMEWHANNGIITVILASGPGQAAGFTIQTQMKLTDSISDSAGTESNSDTVPQNYLTS